MGLVAMQQDWVLSLLRQCADANIPFFFKQWGGVLKSRTGRLLNDRTYDNFPMIVRAGIPDRSSRGEISQSFKGPVFVDPSTQS